MSATAWRLERGPGSATTPVAERDGGATGPTWLLTAGVHGDEYEGPEAIRRVLARLAGVSFPGRVIAVPIANPMAYAAGVRLTPADQGNLNRSFPGDPHGTLTLQWADWLWRRFALTADRLIDLHAGGAAFEFDPVAGFYEDDDAALAAVFGFTQWRAPATPGVFSYEFRRRRGPAIGIELGFGADRDEALTERASQAMARLLRGERDPTLRPIVANHDVTSPHTGEWQSRCRRGQAVAVGELLGELRAFDGTPLGAVQSPVAGRVLAFRRIPSVRAGDLLVGLGVPEVSAR